MFQPRTVGVDVGQAMAVSVNSVLVTIQHGAVVAEYITAFHEIVTSVTVHVGGSYLMKFSLTTPETVGPILDQMAVAVGKCSVGSVEPIVLRPVFVHVYQGRMDTIQVINDKMTADVLPTVGALVFQIVVKRKLHAVNEVAGFTVDNGYPLGGGSG